MSGLKDKQHHPDTVCWQAESFRLTAFLSPSAQIVEQDWWNKLTGELPDRKTSEPKTGIQQEEGRFKNDKIDGHLVLTVHSTRIDWQLVPILEVPDSGFPTIGVFTESVDLFLKLMLHWLETAPSIQRLAFGAVLMQPGNSLKDSYYQLSSYLPFNLDEDSSDFLYQINRPRKLASIEIPDFSINRLSKWSASKWSVSLFAGSASDPSQLTQYVTKPTQFAVRLELDINTTADFLGELSSEKLPYVFQELVKFGKEIASKGDVK